MLGALAIAIAILIVLNAQDKKDQRIAAADGHRHRHPDHAAGAPPLVTVPDWTDRRVDRSSWGTNRGIPTQRDRAVRTDAGGVLGSRTDIGMTTPQHLSDRYELGEILGFGGMSEVHLARDTRLHRDVAIKVLRATWPATRASTCGSGARPRTRPALNHPAIVAVYDTGEAETPDGPLPYIVMEYVDGVTLRDIVHARGPDGRRGGRSRSSPTPARR